MSESAQAGRLPERPVPGVPSSEAPVRPPHSQFGAESGEGTNTAESLKIRQPGQCSTTVSLQRRHGHPESGDISAIALNPK